MQYNMEKFKLVIGTLIDIFLDVREKYDDGKLSTWEIFQLTGWIADIYSVIKNLDGFIKMYQSFTPDQKQEIKTYFNEKFNIDDKKVEKLIEKIFALLIELNQVTVILLSRPVSEISIPDQEIKKD